MRTRQSVAVHQGIGTVTFVESNISDINRWILTLQPLSDTDWPAESSEWDVRPSSWGSSFQFFRRRSKSAEDPEEE